MSKVVSTKADSDTIDEVDDEFSETRRVHAKFRAELADKARLKREYADALRQGQSPGYRHADDPGGEAGRAFLTDADRAKIVALVAAEVAQRSK